MKPFWKIIAIILGFGLVACSTTTITNVEEDVDSEIKNPPTLKTTMGDLVIYENRLVDEVNGQKSPVDQKFLLMILVQSDMQKLDPGTFSLEIFHKMIQENSGKIYIKGMDGSQYISTMAGWVDDEFAVGFIVPANDSFTLYWPENSPIDLIVEGK